MLPGGIGSREADKAISGNNIDITAVFFSGFHQFFASVLYRIMIFVNFINQFTRSAFSEKQSLIVFVIAVGAKRPHTGHTRKGLAENIGIGSVAQLIQEIFNKSVDFHHRIRRKLQSRM